MKGTKKGLKLKKNRRSVIKTAAIRALSALAVLAVCVILGGCAHTHEFGEWITDKEATCTEEGSRHRNCIYSNCEETETEVIESLGHSEEREEKKTEATCTEDGELQELCSRCGEILHTETIPAAGHDPGDWEIVEEAGCTEDGERARFCTVCGEMCESEAIDPTGHSGEWETVREMNENQTGLRRMVCTACGETFEEEIPIELNLSIADAAKKGIISADVTMSAINSGEVKVKNLTEHPLTLYIPAGTYLLSGSSSNQNMLVTVPSETFLSGGQEKTISLKTACMNIHRNIPDSSAAYSVGFTDNSTLARLVELFNERGTSYAVKQAAVWIVTDGASYDDTGVLVSNGNRYISQSDYDEARQLVEEARNG